MEQTAVEWLQNELKKLPYVNLIDVFDAAKEMEKEQIIDAYCIGKYINVDDREFGEQYYNETYGKDSTGI